MRVGCAASILVFLLAACGSSSAASERSASASSTSTGTTQGAFKPPPPRATACGPRDARTVAASPDARVYTTKGAVDGCTIGGRSYQLGASSRTVRENRVAPVALAGIVAGYALSSFGVDTVSAQVVVRDLANGREVHEAAATSVVLPEAFQSVDAIVVKSDGAVAWISHAGSVVSHRQRTEVHRLDTRGPELLDSGSGIAPGSLRLRGSTLTWRHGSVTRRATLR